MDTRKLSILKNDKQKFLSLSEPGQGGDIIARYDPNTDHAEQMAELVRRWNAYPELETALADLVSTASKVEHMMDGDRDKQDAWEEELGRLYVALDEAKAFPKSDQPNPSAPKPYTVVLAYPDYMPNEGGLLSVQVHVHAKDKADAVLVARGEVMEETYKRMGDDGIQNGEDLDTIAVYHGHLTNLID